MTTSLRCPSGSPLRRGSGAILVQVPGRGKKEVQAVKGRLLSRGAYVCLGILSGNLWSMHAHKTTVTVLAGHEVVVRLPDDFPPGEADVIVMPHATVASGRESGADFDRFLASLPTAPVVSLDSLDRGDLYR